MDSNALLASIIRKIIAGERDWTLEELQYHKNNPQEIEDALIKSRLKVPVDCGYEDIMIIPYRWDVSMQRQAKSLFRTKRFLFASEAVAMALYHDMNLHGYICIITDDAESIEIGIFNIEAGFFEAVSTQWLLIDEYERLPIVCDTMLRDLNLTGKIAQIILARTSIRHVDVQNLECVFQRPVLLSTNLTTLCNRGANLMRGVLNGTVKDLILFSVIPQNIGISTDDDLMLKIIPANTRIPTRIMESIDIDGTELSIRQGNNIKANQNPIVSTLHFNDACASQKRKVEITIEIDANRLLKIEAKDLLTNEIAETILC